jgi:hypothetical protein
MLRLHVSVARKVGMPDYGSKGATCGLEVELDSALLADVDSLRRQIRGAYELAALAVQEQLGAPELTEASPPADVTAPAAPAPTAHAAPASAPPSRPPTPARPARRPPAVGRTHRETPVNSTAGHATSGFSTT